MYLAQLFMKKDKTLVLGVVYQPLDNSKYLSKLFQDKFINTLSQTNHENKGILTVDDLNCNYLDHHNPCELKENLKLQGLNQVREMTMRTEHSETLIDMVLRNHPKKIIKLTIIVSEISDHDTTASQKKVNTKYKPKIIQCRSYINYNHNVVQDQLRNTDWTELPTSQSPDQSWISLKTILLCFKLQDTHNRKEC